MASHAKARAGFIARLVQSNHPSIDAARDLILEAKALEAIFAASRNTAKRRKAAHDRLDGVTPGEGFA